MNDVPRKRQVAADGYQLISEHTYSRRGGISCQISKLSKEKCAITECAETSQELKDVLDDIPCRIAVELY